MNCANHTDVAAVAYCRTCGKALCAGCTRDVQGTVYCESCLAARLSHPYAAPAGAAPVPPPAFEGDAKPGLALFLGMIPGVGAMYNGQFIKGIVHAMIFATCIFLTDHGLGPIGAFGIVSWWFYMVFDAYTTAKARKFGMPLPDPFGFNKMFADKDPQFTHTVSQHGDVIGQRMEHAVNDARDKFQNAQANYQPGAYPPQGYAQPAYTPAPQVEPEPEKGIPTSAWVLIGIGVVFLLNTLDIFHFDFGRFWPVILIAIGVWLMIKRRNAALR